MLRLLAWFHPTEGVPGSGPGRTERAKVTTERVPADPGAEPIVEPAVGEGLTVVTEAVADPIAVTAVVADRVVARSRAMSRPARLLDGPDAMTLPCAAPGGPVSGPPPLLCAEHAR